MANVFTAAEVIDMGIEKERKRRDFYGYVADKFNDKEMKELFSRLRDWEDMHIKKFTEIRDSTQDYEIAESYEGEFGAYIRFVVDDLLYKQMSREWFSENIKEPVAAIRYGIGFEKDAILFFNELIAYMMPPHREKIKELVEEEKRHLIYLSGLKKKYEV
jgi:rubrerythrin